MNWQYVNTVQDLLGVSIVDGRPIADILYADTDGPIMEEAARAYHDVADAIAQQVLGGALRSRFIACDPNAACLRQTIRDFGRKAYRRPLTEDEVNTLGAAIPNDVDAATGEELARRLLVDILVSTPFLNRELALQPPDANGRVELTPYALATRISYFVSGSTPDTVLSAAADAAELTTDAQIRAQVERLMQDSKAHVAITRFHRSYVGRNNPSLPWFTREHDPALYPNYANVRRFVAQELDAFFDAVTFARGTFADLFLSNVGFVNADMAPIYGLEPTNFGDALTRTELDPQRRPGFLTRIAFLASYSGYTATEPLARGGYVSSTILGLTLPAPLGTGDPPVPGEFKTQRELVEALYSPPVCNPCHAYLGPPGYALENYDAIGAWQTVDRRGGAIDPVADVFFGTTTETVRSPRDLMSGLSRSEHAQRRYADALVSFALERPANSHDACLAEKLAMRIAQGVPLLDLWADVASSEIFRSETR